jgi:hypothetical protein
LARVVAVVTFFMSKRGSFRGTANKEQVLLEVHNDEK